MYLLVFIQNLLMYIAEKTPLPQPLTFGGGLPVLQVFDLRRCKFLGPRWHIGPPFILPLAMFCKVRL